MPLSNELRIRVARADVEMDKAFSISIMHWQEDKQASNEIDFDCNQEISMPSGGQLHINGDLHSEIKTGGHHDIIVAGNVSSTAKILCSGFCSIFIGGDFNGTIESTGSAKIWIGSNCSGSIKTGSPSTKIRIGGNFNSSIEPLGEMSLLDLAINGFATNDSMLQISKLGYTQFNAAVGESDVAAGIYPTDGHRQKTGAGNSFSRWSIESQNAG
jgi:cytoskeletal protein CcmA (bactofilin family)